MVVDRETQGALERIFPLLPWALTQVQDGVAPLVFADLGPGTKAAVVHDVIMQEGLRRFADAEDIAVRSSQGLLHFVLPGSLLRVKRGDRRTLSIANNRTLQTLEWTYQKSLIGMADPSNRMHLVYVPDEPWATISRCIVALYRGKQPRLPWYEIDVGGWYEAGGATIDPYIPDRQLPPLTLKPGVGPRPLEEIDGTS